MFLIKRGSYIPDKAAMMCDADSRQAGAIEITPAMIEAGVARLREVQDADTGSAYAAEEVFAAMLGPVDEVPDPQTCGCDEDETEVAVGGLVVSGSQSAAVLEL